MALGLGRNPNLEYEKLKDAAAQARKSFDREAWLNLAFYLDEQYVQWDNDSGTIRRIPRASKADQTPRPVVNKIMHFVQQEHAMALQAKPGADVLPASDDFMAIGDAAVAKAYCTYVSEPTNANFDRRLARAVLWAIIAGDGWLKWVWDGKNNRPDISSPSPFEVYVDPYAKELSKARYIVHSQFMDTEQVFEQWGVEVKKGETSSADETRTSFLRGMGSAPVTSGVVVNELWMKPCRRHPDGLYVVWTGTTQLTPAGGHPYKHKRLPFTHIGAIERPDSLHHMSPVKYLRSAQMQLNKYHAQRIMARERFANPKWWIPAELELEHDPDSSPSQILRGNSINGTLKPEIIQPAAMADNGDGDLIESQMMHIVGLHEVSQGQVPGRVEAAKAIEMLKESDADRLQGILDGIDASIAEGWYQMLMLAKQYETKEVLLQAYTREGMPEVKRFKAENIDPGMRIKVTRGTGLARSRAARQDQLLNLWQQRVITDPDLMAELMEVPFPSFAAPKALDMRLARNENIEMADDIAVRPNSWDDHAIHLREHNNYRKTQEYRLLDKEAKQKFEFHCDTHDELLVAVLTKGAQLAMLTNPPAPAGGSATPAPDGATVPA